MRTDRRLTAVWGMVFGYATIGLGIVRNIVLVPIYLKYVATDEYGAWLATGGTLVQLLVSDFGVAGVILQRTAATFGANDRARLGNVIGTAMVTGLVLSLVLSACSAVLVPFVPGLLGLDGAMSQRVTDCFLLAIVANAIGVVGAIATSVLRGLQKAVVGGSIQLAAELVVIAVTVVLLLEGFGLYALAWGMVARAIFFTLASVFQAFVVSVRHLGIRPHFDRREGALLVGDSTRLFMVSISMKVLSRADVFMVGAILGAGSAAVYGLTTRIIDTVNMLLGQINSALSPSMAHLYGEGSSLRFRELVRRLLPVLSAVTLVGLGTAAAVAHDFVHLWVGEALYASNGLPYVFALASYMASLGFVGYDALMAAGTFRYVSAVYAVVSIAHLALSAVLLQFGMLGAPAAAILSSLAWGGLFWRKVMATDAQFDVREILRSLGASVTVTVLPLALLAGFVGAAPTWAWLAAKAVAVAAVLALGIGAASGLVRQAVVAELAATVKALRSLAGR